MSEQPKLSSDSGPGSLAQNLRRARMAADLSVREVHEKTGISPTVLYGYESGKTKPGARELTLICQALKVTPNALLFGSEKPFGEPDSPIDKLLRLSESQIIGPIIGLMVLPGVMFALDVEQKRTLLSIAFTMLKASSPDMAKHVLAVLDDIDAVMAEQGLEFEDFGKLDDGKPPKAMASFIKALEAKIQARHGGNSTKQDCDT